jgi:CBS domain-containing protein
MLQADDSVQRALELFALRHVDVLPVVSGDSKLVGLLDRRAILGAYRRRLAELRGESVARQ